MNFANIDKKKLNYAALLFCAFILLISIILRYPQNNVVYYDSDASYHTLLTMKAYDETPVSVHKFLPIVTLSEKNVPWGMTVPSDGNYYYTSFSSALFFIPYLFFKIFRLSYTLNNLYIFNSFIYLLCAYLSVRLFKKLFINKINGIFVMVATVLICCFQVEVFNSLGAVYWAQSVFQALFIVQILLFLSLDKKRNRIFFYILCLFMPYLEWTGFLSNIAFAAVILFKGLRFNRDKCSLARTGLVLGFTAMSAVIFCLHNLSVLSFDTFSETMKLRFSSRAGGGDFGIPFIKLIEGYWNSFGAFLIVLFIMLIASLAVSECRHKFFKLLKTHKTILFITFFTCLENIFLREHATIYTYDRMKCLLFLTTLFFILFTAIMPILKIKNRKMILSLTFASVFFIIGSINIYLYTAFKTPYTVKVDYMDDNIKVAQFISINCNAENSIIAQNETTRGYVNVLFSRGVFEYADRKHSITLAKLFGKRYAIHLESGSGAWGVNQFKRIYVYDLETETSAEFAVINHVIVQV